MPNLVMITSNAHYNEIERDIYFYHGDHLGSAHWITDSSSVPIQYIHYAPYGELIVNQKPYTYDERYKFTGKERDSETGYDYFGARYYWSTLGIFTSSDPLSGKYPWITSYAYCANNPVKYIDQDGRFPLRPLSLVYYSTAKTLENSMGNNDIRTAGYVMQHPINSFITGTAYFPKWGFSKIAANFQVNLQNNANFTKNMGGQGNAFRHALWQAILTNALGENQAERIGNAHEDFIPQDMTQRFFSTLIDADRMADLLNNSIGRQIGNSNRNVSNQKMAGLVLDEYKNNGLWMISGNDKDGYSVQKSKLSPEQYNQALQVLKNKGDDGLNIR